MTQLSSENNPGREKTNWQAFFGAAFIFIACDRRVQADEITLG